MKIMISVTVQILKHNKRSVCSVSSGVCGRRYFISTAKYNECRTTREAGNITVDRTPVSVRIVSSGVGQTVFYLDGKI